MKTLFLLLGAGALAAATFSSCEILDPITPGQLVPLTVDEDPSLPSHPGKISGVVLSEPGGFTWSDTKGYLSRWMTLSFFDETSNDFVYLDQLVTGDDHITLDYKAALQSAAGFALGNKLGIAGPMPFWREGAVCNAAMKNYAEDHPFDFTKNLSQYTTRVLFMYSELNEAYGKAYAKQVSSAYPNVQLVEITGSGHEMPYFGWDKFYPIAKTYLNTIK
ncbi:MAG: hypothetical protein WBD36_05370 [Bacteroidota bacterium]